MVSITDLNFLIQFPQRGRDCSNAIYAATHDDFQVVWKSVADILLTARDTGRFEAIHNLARISVWATWYSLPEQVNMPLPMFDALFTGREESDLSFLYKETVVPVLKSSSTAVHACSYAMRHGYIFGVEMSSVVGALLHHVNIESVACLQALSVLFQLTLNVAACHCIQDANGFSVLLEKLPGPAGPTTACVFINIAIHQRQFIVEETELVDILRPLRGTHEFYDHLWAKLKLCATCDGFARRSCSLCRKVRYCSSTCQKKHWKAGHRMSCCGRS